MLEDPSYGPGRGSLLGRVVVVAAITAIVACLCLVLAPVVGALGELL